MSAKDQVKPKRKSWRKKTPEEIVRDQEEKLREDIDRLEGELASRRELLSKFERARAIFEG